MNPALDRMPPQAIEAEQALIGCCLIDTKDEAVTTAREIIAPEDFYRNQHGIIFQSICRLHDKKQPTDIITVAKDLEDFGNYDLAGGREYLKACEGVPPAASRCKHYANIISEKAGKRKLIEYACEMMMEAYDDSNEYVEIADVYSQILRNLEGKGSKSGPVRIEQIASKVLEELDPEIDFTGKFIGVPTGFSCIDDKIQGLQNKDLIIVAGRPSMGKTSLGIQFALSASMHNNIGTLMFSIDMSSEAVATRILSMKGNVDSTDLRRRTFTFEQFGGLKRLVGSLGEAEFWIDDNRRVGIREIRSHARKLVRERKIGLIVIDYLQLMRVQGKPETHRLQVADNVKELKALAQDLNLPIVLLSQLSRECEKRDDKRPILSDLAESGHIECEADLVLFPFRPDEYKKHEDMEERKDVEEAFVIVAKHRNGKTGSIPLVYHKMYTRFASVERKREIV